MIVHSVLCTCTINNTRPCRKSRIVGCVEEVHQSVDSHCIDRLGRFQSAKERHAFNLKQKACYAVRCIHTVAYVVSVYMSI